MLFRSEKRLAESPTRVETRELSARHLPHHGLDLRRPDHADVAEEESSVGEKGAREIEKRNEGEHADEQPYLS